MEVDEDTDELYIETIENQHGKFCEAVSAFERTDISELVKIKERIDDLAEIKRKNEKIPKTTTETLNHSSNPITKVFTHTEYKSGTLVGSIFTLGIGSIVADSDT